MREALTLLVRERRARWFLLANVQSAVGTGAAAIALVVLAYERNRSPWAITLVLLADFAPLMVLGPIFGALADRWSRRACAVAADVLSAVAFIGLGLVDSFAATVALAAVAGVGQALFSPAVLAALPSLVAPERGAAITSLYGATRDVGRTLGPLLAALAFPLIGAANLMIVNGATFVLSAIVLAVVPFGAAVAVEPDSRRRLLREAREGLAATWRMAGVRVVLWASTAIIVFAAMINVGELLLANDLGAGASGFAVLMVGYGVGVVVGSLTGARQRPLHQMKARYLSGILLAGVAMCGLALSLVYGAALIGFFAVGLGNGIVVVHERLIFYAAVPDRLRGRAFAVLDTLGAWGFAAAFIGAGAIISAIGTRGMFAVAGLCSLAVWGVAALSLRRVWRAPAVAAAGD